MGKFAGGWPGGRAGGRMDFVNTTYYSIERMWNDICTD